LYAEAKKLGYKGPLSWVGSTASEWKEVVAQMKKEKEKENQERKQNEENRRVARSIMKRAIINDRIKRWHKEVFEPLDQKTAVMMQHEMIESRNCACKNRGDFLAHYRHSKNKCYYFFIADTYFPQLEMVILMLMKRVWSKQEQRFVVEDTYPPRSNAVPEIGQKGPIVAHFKGTTDDIVKLPLRCGRALKYPHVININEEMRNFKKRNMQKYRIAESALPLLLCINIYRYI
jgi:hypothetical protein